MSCCVASGCAAGRAGGTFQRAVVARRRHGHADRRPLSSRVRRSRRGGWDLRSAPLTPRPRHRPPTCFSGAPYCHRDAGGTTSSPPWEDALLFPCSPLSEGRAQPDEASVCSREQREYGAPRRVTGLPGEWGLRENFGGPRVRVGCTQREETEESAERELGRSRNVLRSAARVRRGPSARLRAFAHTQVHAFLHRSLTPRFPATRGH